MPRPENQNLQPSETTHRTNNPDGSYTKDTYVDDILSKSATYYPNNSLKAYETYTDGYRDTRTTYTRHGFLDTHTTYDESDLPKKHTSYYTNGHTKTETTYNSGHPTQEDTFDDRGRLTESKFGYNPYGGYTKRTFNSDGTYVDTIYSI